MSFPSEDHQLAAQLAEDAGALLLSLREQLAADGADARTIKDVGDRAGHEWLVEQLATARPADAVLSEEATEDEQLDSDRLGC